MPEINVRPNCVACGVQFSKADVDADNYFPVSFNMEKGPSFMHKNCIRPGSTEE